MVQVFAVFVMLAILSILIIVHECGHFLVARSFGFQTPVFGFGLPFGPSWTVGHKWGTEFRIHAFLLGGYVAIPELGDESSQEAFGLPLKPFRKFPIWQRALVAFAGVGFNILFAYLVMLIMFFSLGQPSTSVVVAKLPPENPIAMKAGIREGDEIIAINSEKITATEQAIKVLTSHKASQVDIEVARAPESAVQTPDRTQTGGKKVEKEHKTFSMVTNEQGRVGMALETRASDYVKVQGNFFEIAWLALVKLCTLTWGMLDALGQMLAGLFAGPKASGGVSVGIGDLHGVLAVVKIGADIAQQDWSQLFLFTIMISMDLAIINLLPWPALDGGHLAFMFFEAIRGKPVGERTVGEFNKWGFISLIVLMVVIMVNDVTALFTGKLDFKKKGKTEQAQPKKDAAGSSSEPQAATPGGTSSSTPAPNEPATPPGSGATPTAPTTDGNPATAPQPAGAH